MNAGARRSFPLFVLASLLSFAVDAGLFHLLRLALAGRPGALLLPHGGARAVSCVFNYLCNRHLVFRATGGAPAPDGRAHVFERRSFGGYLALVLAVWSLAYLGTKAAHAWWPAVPLLAAKVAVDLLLFLLSYAVQKTFVFAAPAPPLPPGETMC